jgi:5-methylcytosine-specific restriction endonuclease McrA
MNPLSSPAWKKTRAAILASGGVCWLCGHPGADTVDHVVPLSQGGALLDPANLRPAHGRARPEYGCQGNYGRGNRPPKPPLKRSRDW